MWGLKKLMGMLVAITAAAVVSPIVYIRFVAPEELPARTPETLRLTEVRSERPAEGNATSFPAGRLPVAADGRNATAEILNPEQCSPGPGLSKLDHGDPSRCKLPWLKNAGTRPGCVPNSTVEYIRRFVSFSITTGSADGFFRADLILCTWLYHVPGSSLFFFTDNVQKAGDRFGNWVQDVIPQGVSFSKEQQAARGYNIDWARAQFRFLYGLKYIIQNDRDSNTGKRWFFLVDDDTFVNLDGLVAKLRELDSRGHTQHGRYFGDRGWGGAGHLFDRAASETLLRRLDRDCIGKYMVQSFHASDVTLQKCAPSIGLKVIKEDMMSHCQATYLREKLLTGRLVSLHTKRDMAKPDMLAAWRMRLHYQVMYHKNVTAYNLLMKVGNCAYGGCRSSLCREEHDKTKMELFLEVSHNATVMPMY
ncbi:hypothetical protein DIPPA_11709 [Diplonema papillatum]|nr:hypothetical protein DIPPA_11709 [Diplonema papillatum]